MPAGKYSLLIEQGTTLDIELQYRDSSDTPIDLTGYSGKMQIKNSYADTATVTYATLSSDILPDGTGLNFSGSSGDNPPTSGTIGVFISAATSSNFNFDTAYYDIEITTGSIVTRLLQGTIALSKQVTTV
jgi:hypothetical protein